MADLGALAIAWRVGVAVFVIVMPTIMFFQLLRFLEWLRDDDLIAQVVERHDIETDDTGDVLATMATDSHQSVPSRGTDSSTEGTDDDPLHRCEACGHRNARAATYCSGCLGRLE